MRSLRHSEAALLEGRGTITWLGQGVALAPRNTQGGRFYLLPEPPNMEIRPVSSPQWGGVGR